MKDFTQPLSADEASALRDQMIAEIVEPEVRRVFGAIPEVQSAVLCVAQFWSDEAEDAVHEAVLYSANPEPDLAAFRRTRLAFGESDRAYERAGTVLEPDSVLSDEHLKQINDLRWNGRKNRKYWDSNVEAIPAFAAFCEEGAHQEMLPQEAFSPYAILRRSGDESSAGGRAVTVEVVGVMLRPEQDGIPSAMGLAQLAAPGDPRVPPTRSWLQRLSACRTKPPT